MSASVMLQRSFNLYALFSDAVLAADSLGSELIALVPKLTYTCIYAHTYTHALCACKQVQSESLRLLAYVCIEHHQIPSAELSALSASLLAPAAVTDALACSVRAAVVAMVHCYIYIYIYMYMYI